MRIGTGHERVRSGIVYVKCGTILSAGLGVTAPPMLSLLFASSHYPLVTIA